MKPEIILSKKAKYDVDCKRYDVYFLYNISYVL